MMCVFYKGLLTLMIGAVDTFVVDHFLIAGRAWLRTPCFQRTIQPTEDSDLVTRFVECCLSSAASLLAIPKCHAFATCGGHGAMRMSARSSEEAVTKRGVKSATASSSKVARRAAFLGLQS